MFSKLVYLLSRLFIEAMMDKMSESEGGLKLLEFRNFIIFDNIRRCYLKLCNMILRNFTLFEIKICFLP